MKIIVIIAEGVRKKGSKYAWERGGRKRRRKWSVDYVQFRRTLCLFDVSDDEEEGRVPHSSLFLGNF